MSREIVTYDPWAGAQQPPPTQPPGYYQPPQQPPYGQQAYEPGDPDLDKALWAHLGPILTYAAAFVLPFLVLCLWVPPLLIRNSAAGMRNAYVRQQAIGALNCALTSLVVWGVTLVVGVGLLLGGVFASGVSEVAGFALVGVIGLLVLALAALATDLARFVYAIVGCSRARNAAPFAYPWILAFPFVRS